MGEKEDVDVVTGLDLDLADELKQVLAAPRIVRLCVAGQTFEWDIFRLNHMFPNNVIVPLALRAKNSDHKNTADEKGIPTANMQLDVLAVRTIYAYYAHGAILVPSSSEARDILQLTCDFLGTEGLMAKVQAAYQTLQEQPPPGSRELFSFQTPETETHETNRPNKRKRDERDDDGKKGEKNEAEKAEAEKDDENDIALSEPTEQDTKCDNPCPIIMRPKCEPSDEDRRILLQETTLRSAFNPSNASNPSILVELHDLFFQTPSWQERRLDNYTYSIAKALRALPVWVHELADFEMNLQTYSYGVLGPDMPWDTLVVAGGAVLRCLASVTETLPTTEITQTFASYLPVEGRTLHTQDDVWSAMARTEREKVNAVDFASLTPEIVTTLQHALAMHGSSFFAHRRRRWGEIATREDGALDQYVKRLRRETFAPGADIDLFLVTSDPDKIYQAIVYVHRRLVAIHEHICIVRTQHAITFCSKSTLVPHVQIILRAYRSIGQLLVGFDLDSCCLAYDGQRVLATTRGVRALSCGYNLVDVTRLSPTYELRLVKYMRRGFDIAMTEPTLKEHLRQLVGIVTENAALALYPTLLGVTRLAYLLIREYHLLPKGIRLSRIGVTTSDYGASPSLRHFVNRLYRNEDEHTANAFVMGEDLNRTLFGRMSSVPSWLSGRRRQGSRNQESSLGPVRIRTSNVTAQSQSGNLDEQMSMGLFTGSFHPISIAWYRGGIRLPSTLRALACRRPPLRVTLAEALPHAHGEHAHAHGHGHEEQGPEQIAFLDIVNPNPDAEEEAADTQIETDTD